MPSLFFFMTFFIALNSTAFSGSNSKSEIQTVDYKDKIQIKDVSLKILRGAQNGAAYLKAHNSLEHKITLYKIEVEDDFFERIELHDHVQRENADGEKYFEMIDIPEMEIEPGATLELKSGSKHIMLIGTKKSLCQCAALKFTLFFRSNGQEFSKVIEVDAPKNLGCE
jgi:hypothetical protein